MPVSITTTVSHTKPRFDITGQGLPASVIDSNEAISVGLAARLHAYACKRLASSGFASAIDGSSVEIYTLNGEEKPSDRSYTVRFSNKCGGYIELIGIATQFGWPQLDFGLAIGE